MFDSIKKDISSCQLTDQYRLRRKLSELERDESKKGSRGHKNREQGSRNKRTQKDALAALQQEVARSQQACQRRIASIPKNIVYPDNLPVSDCAAEITALLMQNQVLVVAGDTGSGKTTQLPKICLQAGLGRLGLIGHTQPRRLAAVSVANRIAEELGTVPGAGVGYQVRFNEKVSDRTYLKLMTDGILLAEIQNDRFLNRYQVIIIDEAHERSLNIDFLLGFLKQLLRKRRDLKLIVTSATIDVEKFSDHFSKAPTVSVSGRTYPVETRYAPLVEQRGDLKNEQVDDDIQINGIISAVVDIEKHDRQTSKLSGDILVFLSSEKEIRETAIKLRRQKLANTEILPLYSRLKHSEQLKIFKPHPGRRIVLSTNVAETSITVPGINYVIDTGLARISRYSLQSKVQRLPIEAISQASANQRKGRCGRLADGICIRLYAEDDFQSRPFFTDPEIKRTNLASVILRMCFLRLGDIGDFPFLEPPQQKAINEGYKLLIELGALTQKYELTQQGRKMAALPVDPRYARMIVAADSQRCLREILIIVSALSIQDPREISAENRQQAKRRLAEFEHPDSDFLGFVKLWDTYESRRQSDSQGQLRKFCKTNFLSYMRMREWREVHRQLLVSCQQMGFRVNRDAAKYDTVHKSIISGSLNQIASLAQGRDYLGNRNRKFSLFASSVLSGKAAKWIVTRELIETSQVFATLAAKIEPDWVVQMALHLVKREYFEPHWSKKRQEVMAYEKVYLYGLAIIEKSLVSYKKIDPAASREIFINEGLTDNQLLTGFDFYRSNQEFIADLNRQEEKLRRPDLIVSDREVSSFYQQQIPIEICTTGQLEIWLKKEVRNKPDLLQMNKENLLELGSVQARIDEFPDQAAVEQNTLTIDYLFEPGSQQDGATVEVPLALLHQVSQAELDWAVPGILREKCISLMKGLPKSLRKKFIPVSDFVDQALTQMVSADGSLIESLIGQIQAIKGISISSDELEKVDLPNHLKVKIRVLDANAKEIGYGESLQQIRQHLHISPDPSSRQTQKASYNHELEREGLTDWSFGDLPDKLEIGDDLVLLRYPALVDKQESVTIELLPDESEARDKSKTGLLRLFMCQSIQQRNSLRKKFSRFVDRNVLKIPPGLEDLAQDALLASYRGAFESEDSFPRSREEFDAALQRGKSKIVVVAERLEQLLGLILNKVFDITRLLQGIGGGEMEYLQSDIEQQLRHLVCPGFLASTELSWIRQYPRYLDAIVLRLDKAPHMGDKDQQHTEELVRYWRKYEAANSDRLQSSSLTDIQQLQSIRWMIEEYRVSLFAQNLGTSLPVSSKRLDKRFERI